MTKTYNTTHENNQICMSYRSGIGRIGELWRLKEKRGTTFKSIKD
jgi:hypothetical protein